MQTRERTIKVLARNGGQPCRGDSKEQRKCNSFKCPRRFSQLFFPPLALFSNVQMLFSLLLSLLLFCTGFLLLKKSSLNLPKVITEQKKTYSSSPTKIPTSPLVP